jgi:hypothetical protein
MTPQDHSSVVVSFEIDHRDLFRAQLQLAKWRFLVGIIVFVVLSCGVIYFFLLIGERDILLETSPLFIGMPLVALGGQILRMHASARKYVAALPESQRQAQLRFNSGSDGYDLIRGESSSHIAWKDVLSISEKPSYFLIHQNRYEAGILPKRAFRPSDLPTFRNIIQSRLGVRAQVSNPST